MPDTGVVLSIAGFSDPVSSLTHLAAALVFSALGIASSALPDADRALL